VPQRRPPTPLARDQLVARADLPHDEWWMIPLERIDCANSRVLPLETWFEAGKGSDRVDQCRAARAACNFRRWCYRRPRGGCRYGGRNLWFHLDLTNSAPSPLPNAFLATGDHLLS